MKSGGTSQQGEGNRYGQLGVLERESGCRDGKESRCTQPCSIPKANFNSVETKLRTCSQRRPARRQAPCRSIDWTIHHLPSCKRQNLHHCRICRKDFTKKKKKGRRGREKRGQKESVKKCVIVSSLVRQYNTSPDNALVVNTAYDVVLSGVCVCVRARARAHVEWKKNCAHLRRRRTAHRLSRRVAMRARVLCKNMDHNTLGGRRPTTRSAVRGYDHAKRRRKKQKNCVVTITMLHGG